jgi:hypothetical protein
VRLGYHGERHRRAEAAPPSEENDAADDGHHNENADDDADRTSSGAGTGSIGVWQHLAHGRVAARLYTVGHCAADIVHAVLYDRLPRGPHRASLHEAVIVEALDDTLTAAATAATTYPQPRRGGTVRRRPAGAAPRRTRVIAAKIGVLNVFVHARVAGRGVHRRRKCNAQDGCNAED